MKGADAVADAEGPLVGEALCLHLRTVEASRHDDEGAVAAFSRAVAEPLGKVEELAEIAVPHHCHDTLVVKWTAGVESVWSILFEPVRKVAAGDDRRPPPEPLRCLLYEHAEAVVFGERKAGERGAHNFCLYPAAGLGEKMERHKRCVVELSVPLSEPSRRQSGICRRGFKFPDKFLVVVHGEGDRWRAEARETAGGALAGRDVEVVAVEGGVRRYDDHSVGRGVRDESGGLPICLDCLYDGPLLSAPNLRYYERRVRNHDSCRNSHLYLLRSFAGFSAVLCITLPLCVKIFKIIHRRGAARPESIRGYLKIGSWFKEVKRCL